MRHVVKKGITTWKRTPNQTLMAQYKALLKPSCGS
jgi:hypothetical protein